MSRRVLRLALGAPLLTVGLTAASATAGAGAPAAPSLCSAAAFTHHVALVVEHSDGRALRVCIGFDGDSISGEQILRTSGIEYATAGYGSLGDAVCQVDGEPASYPSTCWTSTSPYWALFVSRSAGAWSTSTQGVSSQMFRDGDAEGFRYDPQSGPAAAPISASGTCVLAAAAAPSTPPPAPAPAAPTAAPAAAVPPAPATSPGGQLVLTAPAGASPSPGVVGPRPLARTAASAHAPVNPALLAAVVAAGALTGLLGASLLRRRRRG